MQHHVQVQAVPRSGRQPAGMPPRSDDKEELADKEEQDLWILHGGRFRSSLDAGRDNKARMGLFTAKPLLQ